MLPRFTSHEGGSSDVLKKNRPQLVLREDYVAKEIQAFGTGEDMLLFEGCEGRLVSDSFFILSVVGGVFSVTGCRQFGR